ncbi:MAG: NAD(+) kinase, partial [Arenibacter sp.]|nr:NAD(+) kinase [Arenibacter sp.]
MKVAIYGLTCQNNTLEYILELLEELHKERAEIYFEKDFYQLILDEQNVG